MEHASFAGYFGTRAILFGPSLGEASLPLILHHIRTTLQRTPRGRGSRFFASRSLFFPSILSRPVLSSSISDLFIHPSTYSFFCCICSSIPSPLQADGTFDLHNTPPGWHGTILSPSVHHSSFRSFLVSQGPTFISALAKDGHLVHSVRRIK
jgi:hypothetical protein